MELTVYRQAQRVRDDGTIVYKGEDTLPYVDDKILLVADGMGGGAGIRHTTFNKDLFNEDLLMDTLFSGVFEDYSDPRFVEYVKKSFAEFYAVKDCYFDNPFNIKKSGYFASRIATAVFLHMMFYEYKDIDIVKSLDDFSKLDEEVKKVRLQRLSEIIAANMGDKIKKIAKNANLEYESKISGLALLGTTLCATVFSEDEDSVETHYFTAGDSRPYAWTVDDGLCQLLADQEREDGGMSNYIKANEDSTFEIRVDSFSFPKKCMLMNTSDGCFDSAAFLSQMAFEYLLLKSIIDSANMEEVAEKLTEFFVANGTHDDSSTIALKVFGYQTMEELQEDCKKRMDEMNTLYFSKMEDLLEKDYVSELQSLSKIDPAKVKELTERFGELDSAKELSKSKVVETEFKPYCDAKAELSGKKEEAKEAILSAHDKIKEVVSHNYTKLWRLLGPILGGGWEISRALQMEKNYEDEKADYWEKIEAYKAQFDESIESLKSSIEQIYEIGIPEDYDDYADVDFGLIEDIESKMEKMFEFFTRLGEKKNRTLNSLLSARNAYIEKNEKLAERDPKSVEDMVNKILEGAELDEYRLIPYEMQIIEEAKGEIAKNEEVLANMAEEMDKVLDESAEKYWKMNCMDLVKEMLQDETIEIDEALKAEAMEVFNPENDEIAAIREKADLQEQLFAQYEVKYGMYMEAKDEH